MEVEIKLEGFLLNTKYQLIKQIGCGSFGSINEGLIKNEKYNR